MSTQRWAATLPISSHPARTWPNSSRASSGEPRRAVSATAELRACVTTLRARLDHDVADGLLSEGRQLSTEDALALARRTLRDLGAGR